MTSTSNITTTTQHHHQSHHHHPPKPPPMAATASAPTHRPPPPPPPPGPDHPSCPRCESQETKFCYYNNYNLAQPRYFCKACRRYWTLGGTLRNIPVGGTTRKAAEPAASVTKRRRTRPAPASSASSTSTSSPSSPSAANPPPAAASEEHLGATGMPADVAGTFGQLMMEPLPLLREPFLGSSRLGFGLGLGLGLGGIEELGFGLGRAGWSFLGADDGGLMVGADAWQVPGTVTGPGDDAVAGGDAAADAGAFLPPWPDLTISSRRIQ